MIVSSNEETQAQNFKTQQSKHSRVQAAMAEKESSIKSLFQQKKIPFPPARIFLRAFKREQKLELWVSRTTNGKFEFLKDYPFCSNSGTLGPKRQQGDGQIPEGFYYIDRFNPMSNFHLSLGVNYPNQSDKILGERGNLGGDIFIHGNCVTIGCIPITDELIKELYLIAVEVKSAGQSNIPVHIFPSKMDSKGTAQLEREFGSNADLWRFWMNLKEGYDYFERHNRLPAITVDKRGRYVIGE
jgi:murein L,D-transpeptidase YafK